MTWSGNNNDDICLVVLASPLIGKTAGRVSAAYITDYSSHPGKVYMMGYPNCSTAPDSPPCCPVDTIVDGLPVDNDDLALWGAGGCLTKVFNPDSNNDPQEAEASIAGSGGQSGSALLSLSTPWLPGQPVALGVYSEYYGIKPSYFTLITKQKAAQMAFFMSLYDSIVFEQG